MTLPWLSPHLASRKSFLFAFRRSVSLCCSTARSAFFLLRSKSSALAAASFSSCLCFFCSSPWSIFFSQFYPLSTGARGFESRPCFNSARHMWTNFLQHKTGGGGLVCSLSLWTTCGAIKLDLDHENIQYARQNSHRKFISTFFLPLLPIRLTVRLHKKYELSEPFLNVFYCRLFSFSGKDVQDRCDLVF